MATAKTRALKRPGPKVAARALPADVKKTLEGLGVPIKPWDPKRIEAVLRGHLTLGELAGVSKQQQFEMAATGVKFLKDGLVDKAVQVFLGLEALDPYDAYVQVCLGSVAMEKELFEVAEQRFSRALTLNPFSVPALAYRGEVRLRVGKVKEGREDLEAALKADPAGKQPPTPRARALLEAQSAADKKPKVQARR